MSSGLAKVLFANLVLAVHKLISKVLTRTRAEWTAQTLNNSWVMFISKIFLSNQRSSLLKSLINLCMTTRNKFQCCQLLKLLIIKILIKNAKLAILNQKQEILTKWLLLTLSTSSLARSTLAPSLPLISSALAKLLVANRRLAVQKLMSMVFNKTRPEWTAQRLNNSWEIFILKVQTFSDVVNKGTGQNIRLGPSWGLYRGELHHFDNVVW